MAKISRNQSTGRFTVISNGDGSATICDTQSGKCLPLEGYGALKDEFEVREGLDLTKPIAAQVLTGNGRKAAATKAR